MRLLIVDTDGVGLSTAVRAVEAGHLVRWYVKPKKMNFKEAGEGFKGVQRVGNWLPSVPWADVVLPTSNDDFLGRLTQLKKSGYPIFGPTTESAALEINRGQGLELLSMHNIESAPYLTFKKMEQAYAHVLANPGDRYVFKTLGDNEDKALTYVSKHAADMVSWMEGKMQTTRIKGDVMLQTFVDGIEMGVSRFMGRDGWVGPWNESFEHKKLMSGNYGPNTGEQGTVAYFTPESKLGEETLAKLEYALRQRGHIGDVALGFMIEKTTGMPRPNEFTCRLGWPIWNLMLGSIRDDPVKWMLDALEGRDTTTFKTDIGCCLVVATPPYPEEPEHRAQALGNPIYGVTNGNRKHIHPQGVMIMNQPDIENGKIVRRPTWSTAGTYNCVVTGFGSTVKQACERAYKTTKQIHISNMLVRDDIGEKLKEQLPALHKQGYADWCTYE